MTSRTTYDVTVAKGEQKVLDVPNDKKTQLIVLKKDAQTGQLLAGATIKATLLRSNTPPFEAGQPHPGLRAGGPGPRRRGVCH